MVDAVAEVCDQLHLLAGLGDQMGVDGVGDRGNQYVGLSHSLGDFGFRHRLVIEIQMGVEKFAHSRLDEFREPARNDDIGFFLRHGRRPRWYCGASKPMARL